LKWKGLFHVRKGRKEAKNVDLGRCHKFLFRYDVATNVKVPELEPHHFFDLEPQNNANLTKPKSLFHDCEKQN
jgi:hypothetical protein